MKKIEWRETAARYGAPVMDAFVGEHPVARVSYTLKSRGESTSYTWRVMLPILPQRNLTMTGTAPDGDSARYYAELKIIEWFRETE